ncbi:MAG TPA: response regulator transcription factor [Thermoleophilaceae bacterium]|jgi:DNA-binding NarL/FixJ family response regulator|nr:response regulator transcription factor [Thermoleophilaceae bacterium]
MSIRVLLADDEDMVRSGFRLVLVREPDIEVVGEAVDGAQVVSEAGRLRPDVVLMDIRMPMMDGIEATRQIAAGDSGARVIVLTTFDEDAYVYGALRAGASGFLLKYAPADELVRAIRIVAGGEAMLAPAVTRRVIEQFARRAPDANAAARIARLSPRERDVLRLVARGHTNAEIAAELVVSPATVKTHVARTLEKLGVRDRVQATALAFEADAIEPDLDVT